MKTILKSGQAKLLAVLLTVLGFIASCNQQEPVQPNNQANPQIDIKSEVPEQTVSNDSYEASLARATQAVNLGLQTSAGFRDYVLSHGVNRADQKVLLYTSHQSQVVQEGQTLQGFLADQYKILFPKEANPFSAGQVNNQFPLFRIQAPTTYLQNPSEWGEENTFASVLSYSSQSSAQQKTAAQMAKEYPTALAKLEAYNAQNEFGINKAHYYVYEDNVMFMTTYQSNDPSAMSYQTLSKGTVLASMYVKPKSEEAGIAEGTYHVYVKANADGGLETKLLQGTENIESKSLLGSYQQAYNPVYIDVPTCHYPECGSPAIQQMLNDLQQWANKHCETTGTCYPCCEPGGGVRWTMVRIEPTSLRCMKHDVAVLALDIGFGTLALP
ncbi:MAG TPA: hypothetical protein DCS93_37930 [Microscillaceae bacterium]|nr:hypothetical protein [Microscillaceae bacterium]